MSSDATFSSAMTTELEVSFGRVLDSGKDQSLLEFEHRLQLSAEDLDGDDFLDLRRRLLFYLADFYLEHGLVEASRWRLREAQHCCPDRLMGPDLEARHLELKARLRATRNLDDHAVWRVMESLLEALKILHEAELPRRRVETSYRYVLFLLGTARAEPIARQAMLVAQEQDDESKGVALRGWLESRISRLRERAIVGLSAKDPSWPSSGARPPLM